VVANLAQLKLREETFQVTPSEWKARLPELRSRQKGSAEVGQGRGQWKATLQVFEESPRGKELHKRLNQYFARVSGPQDFEREIEQFVREVYGVQ